MATQKKRRLGSFERAETLTSERFAFNVVVVVRLTGTLEQERLRSGLDALQRQHPLLRACIRGAGRGRFFEIGGVGPIPLRREDRSDDESWQGAVERELVTAFDLAEGPFLRVLRVGKDSGASELVLTFHHAIVDAVSVHYVAQELVRLSSATDGSVSEASETALRKSGLDVSIPPSADEIFPSAYRGIRRWPASLRFLARQAVDEIAFRWRSRGRSRPTLDGRSFCRVLSFALTQEETAALVRASRRRRVGLYGLLSAAMLLAVVRQRYRNHAGPHRYFAFPLLRPYLDPPVASDVVAGYLTTMRLTLQLEPSRGLWHAATAIHHQVDRAAKRGERYLASRWSAASMKLLLGQTTRMGTTALNYAGATRLDVAEGASFSIEGFHAFVTDFPRGPEYTGQSRVFDGRLWFDLVYLDTDMDRQEAGVIAEAMRDLLVEGIEGEQKGEIG